MATLTTPAIIALSVVGGVAVVTGVVTGVVLGTKKKDEDETETPVIKTEAGRYTCDTTQLACVPNADGPFTAGECKCWDCRDNACTFVGNAGKYKTADECRKNKCGWKYACDMASQSCVQTMTGTADEGKCKCWGCTTNNTCAFVGNGGQFSTESECKTDPGAKCGWLPGCDAVNKTCVPKIDGNGSCRCWSCENNACTFVANGSYSSAEACRNDADAQCGWLWDCDTNAGTCVQTATGRFATKEQCLADPNTKCGWKWGCDSTISVCALQQNGTFASEEECKCYSCENGTCKFQQGSGNYSTYKQCVDDPEKMCGWKYGCDPSGACVKKQSGTYNSATECRCYECSQGACTLVGDGGGYKTPQECADDPVAKCGWNYGCDTAETQACVKQRYGTSNSGECKCWDCVNGSCQWVGNGGKYKSAQECKNDATKQCGWLYACDAVTKTCTKQLTGTKTLEECKCWDCDTTTKSCVFKATGGAFASEAQCKSDPTAKCGWKYGCDAIAQQCILKQTGTIANLADCKCFACSTSDTCEYVGDGGVFASKQACGADTGVKCGWKYGCNTSYNCVKMIGGTAATANDCKCFKCFNGTDCVFAATDGVYKTVEDCRSDTNAMCGWKYGCDPANTGACNKTQTGTFATQAECKCFNCVSTEGCKYIGSGSAYATLKECNDDPNKCGWKYGCDASGACVKKSGGTLMNATDCKCFACSDVACVNQGDTGTMAACGKMPSCLSNAYIVVPSATLSIDAGTTGTAVVTKQVFARQVLAKAGKPMNIAYISPSGGFVELKLDPTDPASATGSYTFSIKAVFKISNTTLAAFIQNVGETIITLSGTNTYKWYGLLANLYVSSGQIVEFNIEITGAHPKLLATIPEYKILPGGRNGVSFSCGLDNTTCTYAGSLGYYNYDNCEIGCVPLPSTGVTSLTVPAISYTSPIYQTNYVAQTNVDFGSFTMPAGTNKFFVQPSGMTMKLTTSTGITKVTGTVTLYVVYINPYGTQNIAALGALISGTTTFTLNQTLSIPEQNVVYIEALAGTTYTLRLVFDFLISGTGTTSLTFNKNATIANVSA